MTIEVEHRAKRESTITATIGASELSAHIIEGEHLFTVRGRGTQEFKLDHGPGLDTLIELLHAVKSVSTDAAASIRRLTEAFDAADIIAVTEPTA